MCFTDLTKVYRTESVLSSCENSAIRIKLRLWLPVHRKTTHAKGQESAAEYLLTPFPESGSESGTKRHFLSEIHAALVRR